MNLRNTLSLVFSVALGSSLMSCADTSNQNTLSKADAGGAQQCEDGPTIMRNDIVSVSENALRRFYGITNDSDETFRDGTVGFHEFLGSGDTECGFDDSYIFYQAPLPRHLRPRPEDAYVAMIWGLDGIPDLLVMVEEDDMPLVDGQYPLLAILNLDVDVPIADGRALAERLGKEHPRADVIFLEGVVGEHASGIDFGFGRSMQGLNDPTLVKEMLDVLTATAKNPLVEHTNLASYLFDGESSRSGTPKAIAAEAIDIDCLRDFSASKPRRTYTELPSPLGRGRHYNLDDCPIAGWPDECEFADSAECIAWQEEN